IAQRAARGAQRVLLRFRLLVPNAPLRDRRGAGPAATAEAALPPARTGAAGRGRERDLLRARPAHLPGPTQDEGPRARLRDRPREERDHAPPRPPVPGRGSLLLLSDVRTVLARPAPEGADPMGRADRCTPPRGEGRAMARAAQRRALLEDPRRPSSGRGLSG